MSKKPPRSVTQLADQDYRRKLTPEENAYLTRFNREYYGGSIKKWDRKAIHKGAELRRDCYNRNHCMRRDLWNAYQVPLSSLDTEDEVIATSSEVEDELIDFLDQGE